MRHQSILQEAPHPKFIPSRDRALERLQGSVLRRSGWPRRLLVLAAAALLTAVSLHTFTAFVPAVDGWSVYWPFNGILIAVLLLCPRSDWPSILVGVAAIFYTHERLSHDPISECLVVTLANLAEVLIAAYALPPFRGLQAWLLEPHLVRRFILYAVLVGPAILSLPAAWYYHLASPGIGFWQLFRLWGLAGAVGSVLWAPMVLVLFSRETYWLFRWPRLLETTVLLGLLALAGWVAFSQRIPMNFLPYPVLLLVGLRLNFSGAVLGVNLLSMLACSLTLHGCGPLSHAAGESMQQRLVLLQIYLTLAVLTVFPLSVTLIERKNLEIKLREAYTSMALLASLDSLTNIANRRRFDEVLAIEWARAE